MTARIMIVDDEQPIRESLKGLFEDEGYLVACAASGEEAMARLRKQAVDCILLDIWMPGIDGLETLNRIKQQDPDLPVIMMSGHATIDTAVKATRQGAFDFVEKPLSSDHLLVIVRNAVERYRLKKENADLKRNGAGQRSREELLGESAAINEVRHLIQRVAQTDSPVLIIGEHGTGKALAARLVHRASKRKAGPYIEVKIASIPDKFIDSELFGHEKGAFPGALHTQRGRFEAAHQGTLFLDELTELTLSAQAKVLHVMRERYVQRLGNPARIPADVRVIGASARDLEQALRDQILREDFYYRINVVTIRMPPLRERIEDLPLLVGTLAEEQAQALGGDAVSFTEDALAILQQHSWPGNIRELRNYIERCHILMPGETITPENMPPLDQRGGAPSGSALLDDLSRLGDAGSFRAAREAFERRYLLKHLEANNWNISRTAAEIGMERSQLHRKIKALGLIPAGKRVS